MANQTQEATDEKTQVGLSLSRSLDRAIEFEATHRDCTKSQLVEVGMRQFLKLPASGKSR